MFPLSRLIFSFLSLIPFNTHAANILIFKLKASHSFSPWLVSDPLLGGGFFISGVPNSLLKESTCCKDLLGAAWPLSFSDGGVQMTFKISLDGLRTLK